MTKNVTARYSSDLSLVRKATQGDSESRESLGRRMQCIPAFVRSIASERQLRWTREEVDDLSQQCAEVSWSRLPSYEGRARLETWWYGVAIRLVQARARRVSQAAKRKSEYLRHLREQSRTGAVQEEPADGQSERMLKEILGTLLESVGEPNGTVLRLRYFQQLSYPEIASRLHLPVGTVRSQHWRALQRAKEHWHRLDR